MLVGVHNKDYRMLRSILDPAFDGEGFVKMFWLPQPHKGSCDLQWFLASMQWECGRCMRMMRISPQNMQCLLYGRPVLFGGRRLLEFG